MEYGLLFLSTLFGSGTNITVGFYNKKGKNAYLFGFISALISVLFFSVVAKFSFDFQWVAFWYAIGFGICYTCAMLFSIFAIKYGSVSLTSLVMSYSLVIPTVFAIFAYGEFPSWSFYIGVILLVISLFFVGVPREKGESYINLMWILMVFIAFLGNGGCSLLQTHYQRLSGGLHRSEFMIIGNLLYLSVCIIAAIICRKHETTETAKSALIYGSLNGISTSALNYLIMVLVGLMSASLVYPLYSSISVIISILACRLFFKEKPDRLTLCGIVTGIISIIFLNI